MLVDVFHWFDKSNQRKNTLEEFCEFMGQEYKKIIKYVFTCWLSLESSVTWCLKLYPSLKPYFLSVDKKGNQRFDRLFGKFSDPMTEIYMYFYQFSLQPVIQFNLYLQQEDSLISKLHAQFHCHLCDFTIYFIKALLQWL